MRALTFVRSVTTHPGPLLLLIVVFGCSHGREVADTGAAATGFRCIDCLASADCGSDQCIQYALDVACAPSCAADGSCASGSSCQPYSTVSGDQVLVCVPDVPQCGAVAETDAGADLPDAGWDAAMPATCGGLIGPSETACCRSCTTGGTCGTNGCYGGWWCNTASCRCQTPPTSCSSPIDAGGTGPIDAGPPPTGSVGPTGGTVNRLFFAVLGDSRPASETDGTTTYPTTIVHQLYTDIEALSPRPEFALVTGD